MIGWTFDDERLTANQFDKMSAFNGSMHGGSVHGSIHGSQFHGSQYHGKYCGIVIVRGRPMFVAFVDNPCLRI